MDNRIFAKITTSLPAFLEWLVIEIDGRQRRLADSLDDWQRQDFAALEPGLRRVAGLPVDGDVLQRAYLERPRGHSKTQDIAVMASWVLVASRRPIVIAVAAADVDQAALLRDAIVRLEAGQPALGELLDVGKSVVRNKATGSELRIISGDVASSYGILPDLVVADELCHWPDSGEQLWHSLLSAAAKKPTCMLVVISNAGVGIGTAWQWGVREAARTSPDWYFHRLDGSQASWISAKRLEELRRMLPPSVYDRLIGNNWQTESGDLLSSDQIDAATVHDGPVFARQSPSQFPCCGIGLDLATGGAHHSSLAVLLGDRYGKLRVGRILDWPASTSLSEVKAAIERMGLMFKTRALFCDSWQAVLLGEELTAAGWNVECTTQSTTVLTGQAVALQEVFESGGWSCISATWGLSCC